MGEKISQSDLIVNSFSIANSQKTLRNYKTAIIMSGFSAVCRCLRTTELGLNLQYCFWFFSSWQLLDLLFSFRNELVYFCIHCYYWVIGQSNKGSNPFHKEIVLNIHLCDSICYHKVASVVLNHEAAHQAGFLSVSNIKLQTLLLILFGKATVVLDENALVVLVVLRPTPLSSQMVEDHLLSGGATARVCHVLLGAPEAGCSPGACNVVSAVLFSTWGMPTGVGSS